MRPIKQIICWFKGHSRHVQYVEGVRGWQCIRCDHFLVDPSPGIDFPS